MRVALQGVEKAVKVDALTVDLVMREPNPVLLRTSRNFRIMSKAWAVKNGAVAAAGLQGQGGHLRLAQRQRHRRLHGEGAPAGRAHGPRRAQGLVGPQGGTQRGQPRRSRDAAHQVERHARRGAALGRGGPPASTRPRRTWRGCAPSPRQDRRGRGASRPVPRLRRLPRRPPLRQARRAGTRSRTCACARPWPMPSTPRRSAPR